MFKKNKTLIGLGIAVLVVAFYTFQSYNGLVAKDEAVATTWGNLQSQYQRRADLVPNLISTVKGYAKHESGTFEAVVNARAKATQTTISADNLSEAKLKEVQAAQGELSQAIGRLLMVAENYPELKASENFSELQTQLEGTENRINETRRLYNESVKVYNVSVRSFPKNIIAGLFGFEKKAQFEAEAGAQKAPDVQF